MVEDYIDSGSRRIMKMDKGGGRYDTIGKGRMSPEFPSEGKPQGAHMGSQSESPTKEDQESGKSDNFYGGLRDLNPFSVKEAY